MIIKFVDQASMPSMDSKTINIKKKEELEAYRGVGIHSQVRKVKQEMEKINHVALQQPEARPALRELARHHHRSRSPLGLVERPISVGN